MIDYITLTGGVVADPELRHISSGAAVASFRIAQSDSKKNESGEWETTQSLYLPVTIWNDNPQYKQRPVPWAQIAAALRKGDKVAVRGKLVTRTWQAKDGSNRSQIELAATELYPAPSMPQDTPQQYAQQGGFGQQAAASQHQGNTWGTPAPTGQAGGSADEQPPF